MASKLDRQNEVRALATLIVRMYGGDAPAQAAQHAKVMRDLGNDRGFSMWTRISHSAKDLLAKERDTSEAIH